MTNASPAVASPALIERYLACPVTHRPLNVEGDTITCPESGFTGSIRDGVAVVSSVVPSFFDSRFEVMQQGHELEGEKSFCYSQQTALLESYFNAGQVLLDVGCGPSLPYAKHPDSFVIGLESSFESIRANVDVDLRVFGSAAALPLPDASIDIVICFYSIHHMVGDTRRQTADNVASAFREFGRVLKPGGFLFVFEMTPIIPFVFFQALAWNTVRSIAPKALDMFFFSTKTLTQIADEALPKGVILERIFFGSSAFTIIPPVFSLPWLKVPRLLYPLDAKLYKWRKINH